MSPDSFCTRLSAHGAACSGSLARICSLPARKIRSALLLRTGRQCMRYPPWRLLTPSAGSLDGDIAAHRRPGPCQACGRAGIDVVGDPVHFMLDCPHSDLQAWRASVWPRASDLLHRLISLLAREHMVILSQAGTRETASLDWMLPPRDVCSPQELQAAVQAAREAQPTDWAGPRAQLLPLLLCVLPFTQSAVLHTGSRLDQLLLLSRLMDITYLPPHCLRAFSDAWYEWSHAEITRLARSAALASSRPQFLDLGVPVALPQ